MCQRFDPAPGHQGKTTKTPVKTGFFCFQGLFPSVCALSRKAAHNPLKPAFLSQIIPAEKRESPPCGGLGGRWMRLSGKPCARADHCTTSLTRMATLGGIKNPPPSKRGTARDGVGENGQQSHRPCAKGSGCGLLGAVRAVAALSVRALYCSHRAVSLLDSHLAALT